MRGNLDQALQSVSMTYNQLVEIAEGIVKPYVQDVNEIVEEAKNSIELMTNDYIRELMLKLSINSFRFSEMREKSMLMSTCAEIVRKEAYAKEFGAADGSVAAKENIATINIADEILTDAIYETVAALLKTKVDEVHRVVDTLKTVLTSRLSEAKLNMTADGMDQ